MSLSELPSAKITYTTAREISDEILGGTITFCKDTGYRHNIMMYTIFWSGFLFAAKDSLIEYDIIDDVRNSYIQSLRTVFPTLLDTQEKCDNTKNLCEEFWNNLSDGFCSLHNDDELTKFFDIANNMNCRGAITPIAPIKDDTQKIFSRISSNINSSIYRIIHQINSDFAIQYKFVLNEYRFSQHSHSNNSNHQTTNTPHTTYPEKSTIPNKAKTFSTKQIVIIALVIIIGIIVMVNIFNNPDSELESITEPRSGAILSGSEHYNESEITVTASKSESCVVKLKTRSGITRLSFYVRAGDTVTIGVPCEYLYVYFASGDTWYGETHLFGEHTSYSMDDSICNFADYTWEYTLYPVSSGNFEQTPIDEDDFK